MNDFQLAMLETALENVAGPPCLLCGVPGTLVGVWQPSPTWQPRVGAPEGKTRLVIYSLCAPCAARADAGTRVENLVLATAARRRAALAAGWEIDGDLAYRPGSDVPDWVREALDAYPVDLTGAFFAWRTDPYRCLKIRLRAGVTDALCEAGREPPPLPDCLCAGSPGESRPPRHSSATGRRQTGHARGRGAPTVGPRPTSRETRQS
jgi:hypothetical protein